MVCMNDPLIRAIPSAQLIGRSHFGGLLRRSKSSEKKSKKKLVAREFELEKERQNQLDIAVRENPPTIYQAHEILKSNQSSISNDSHNDVASLKFSPLSAEIANFQLPNFASETRLVNDGDYSYNGVLNSSRGPHRLRKRKGPASFNILILGTKSCGKTSFLNFLKSSFAPPPTKKISHLTDLREDIFAPPYPRIGNFEKHYFETTIDSDRVNLTLWDSQGLEKETIDYQLQEILLFIESKFETTFREELKVNRAPFSSRDTHIHFVFFLLDPLHIDQNIATFNSATLNNSYLNGQSEYSALDITGRMEDDIEIKVIRALQGKAIVLPIIAKADIVTSTHMDFLKRKIREKLWKANLNPFDVLETEDDVNDSFQTSSKTDTRSHVIADGEIEDLAKHKSLKPNRNSITASIKSTENTSRLGNCLKKNSTFPFSTISPDLYDPQSAGRKFPWGLADPLNSEHCDFVYLKNMVFYEWRDDLQEVCRNILYERWRTNRFLRCVQQ
ncbi:Septin-8-B [Erysiphe necator]|nr:Septin-8-B [Erysiphe necator]